MQLHCSNPKPDGGRAEQQRRHAIASPDEDSAALCGIFPLHAGWSWKPASGEVNCPRCQKWLAHARQRAEALDFIASKGAVRTAAVAERLGMLPSAAYQVLDRLFKEDRLSRRRVSSRERLKTVVSNEWRLTSPGQETGEAQRLLDTGPRVTG